MVGGVAGFTDRVSVGKFLGVAVDGDSDRSSLDDLASFDISCFAGQPEGDVVVEVKFVMQVVFQERVIVLLVEVHDFS